MARKRVSVWRCPKCGSTRAGPDESQSAYELTYMACLSCGHAGLFDSWERNADWLTKIDLDADTDVIPDVLPPLAPGKGIYDEPEQPRGCERCFASDAGEAYDALTANRETMLEQESHFSMQVTSCRCGQKWCVVFTERVDWRAGEDDQTWVCVPLTVDQVRGLQNSETDKRASYLQVVTKGRRFLVREFPTGGCISAWWRDSGFAIGPHD